METDHMMKYREYLQRIASIRSLSSPSLQDIDSADDYARKLRENFVRIGELSADNRSFLDTELYPLITSEVPLSADKLDEIKAFSGP